MKLRYQAYRFAISICGAHAMNVHDIEFKSSQIASLCSKYKYSLYFVLLCEFRWVLFHFKFTSLIITKTDSVTSHRLPYVTFVQFHSQCQ